MRPARQPIEGVDKNALVAAIRAHGHRQALPLDKPEDLPRLVKEIARPGDYVVFLGAGNITQWAYALPAQLAARCDDARSGETPLPFPPPRRGRGRQIRGVAWTLTRE